MLLGIDDVMFSYSSSESKRITENKFYTLKRELLKLHSELERLSKESDEYKKKSEEFLKIQAQISRLVG
jgi:hypothetical protein